MIRAACIVVLMSGVCVSSGLCDEGIWLPQKLPDEILSEMRERGCELTQEDIFNIEGTGVSNAVVNLGATGSFVSPEGLILTNHHVAFGAVQRMSTPEKNYIEQGFLAKTKDEEVPALGYIVYVVQTVDDVTERILSAIDPSMSHLERYNAIERRTKEIIREREADRDVYCEVHSFFGGAEYLLYTFLKIKDVRVVYVPSRSIGEYGGDIDNWMWPRHTGDFSFLRAYVAPGGKTTEFSEDNVPYRPKTYLKIAPEGLADGDFALVIGFPGRTNRYLTSHALADFENFEYPQNIRLYKQMLAVLEKEAAADPIGAVRVASRIKGTNNRLKNNEGMLEGFKKFNLVERQKENERQFLAKVKGDPEMSEKYGTLLHDLGSLYAERSEHAMKDLLLDFALYRSSLLGQAMLLYKWSNEKQKDDLDRDPGFMDRRIPDLKRSLRLFQTQLHVGSDRELMKMFLREFADLPEGQRVGALEDILADRSGAELDESLESFLEGLYGNTKLVERAERLRMFDLSHDELMREEDSFIELAAKLYEENEARIDRGKSFSGALKVLAPKWIDAIAAASERILYSDANGTMRLNFGNVKGYHPRDAVYFEPFTTFQGVADKHTGVAPFDCPERILELAASERDNSYVSTDLGDVPVNLLTTHDSTGGNSGSPLLNARGELVGCLFDGNYESMTSDFLFQDDVTRSIHVDIRYVLFVADFVDNAHNVLRELGLK
ncbi:MAG: hypothetical protein AMJ46_03610 [Latescibacteria bacterium DG_63]|nr:MAG: hypothetical protein AMJ46_03610 [Latescibacteria bacterium DG_63]